MDYNYSTSIRSSSMIINRFSSWLVWDNCFMVNLTEANRTSAPGFFAKAEMGSIRFQRRKIFLAVIAFGGPRSSCSGRGVQLPFGTLCATGLRK
jgi:hypothetical protein